MPFCFVRSTAFEWTREHYLGRGVPVDDVKAVSWYQRAAADTGNPRAGMEALAEAYENGQGVVQDKTKAWQLVNAAADRGDPTANRIVGSVKAQEHKFLDAIFDLRSAAKAGDTEAMCRLGAMIYNGEGTDRDPDKATGWFQNAADSGNAAAMYVRTCYRWNLVRSAGFSCHSMAWAPQS